MHVHLSWYNWNFRFWNLRMNAISMTCIQQQRWRRTLILIQVDPVKLKILVDTGLCQWLPFISIKNWFSTRISVLLHDWVFTEISSTVNASATISSRKTINSRNQFISNWEFMVLQSGARILPTPIKKEKELFFKSQPYQTITVQ